MGADAEPLSDSLIDLIGKSIRIVGSQQKGPEYLYEALDFVAPGKVKTIVETYPLAEAQGPTTVLQRARPALAPSSQCNRRFEPSWASRCNLR
jgi:D-arabinose 1-dehydrogenase-like Zn-dependent alcohol dehydrogenase